MEPHFYKVVLVIFSFHKAHPKTDPDELAQHLEPTIDTLEHCLKVNDNCSNLYYIRSLIFYVLGKFSLAHQNIEKAIEKADENYAKYYHLRGAIYACTQSYYNAISDLSIALNLDKNFQSSYLERAKCYYIIGDLKQAFMDIQDYITVKSDDSNIHLWAGNLLFCTGAYEDAVKAYSNSETISNSENLLALRTKCNIILKELNLALQDLDRLIELKTANNIHYYIDRECLVALKTATVSSNEDLERENLLKAIQKVTKVLSYKVSGNIFSLQDLYFYKSVFHFYLGEYQEALNEINRSWEVKEEAGKPEKEAAPKEGSEYDAKEMIKLLEDACSNAGSDEVKEESGRVGAITSKEFYYNKAIYLLMMKSYDESLEILLQLRVMLPADVSVNLDPLIVAVNEQLQKTSKNAKSMLFGCTSMN